LYSNTFSVNSCSLVNLFGLAKLFNKGRRSLSFFTLNMRFSGELIELLRKEFPIEGRQPVKSRSVRRFEGEYVINRYPIMIALAFCVARKCGYSLKLSKSMAVAVATNYAILKNIGGGIYYGKAKRQGKKTLDEQIFDNPESLEEFETKMFCGCELIVKDDLVIGLARVRGKQKPFSPSKFDWEMRKLDAIRKNGSKFLMRAINKELERVNVREMADAPFASRGQGYFVFWKQIRDKMRQKSFWFK